MDTVLDVFVDTAIAKPFSIQVGLWDTVLTMKQKIENSQGIPVSKQVLFFGSKVLYNNLDIMQCKIFHNCHLFLVISPDFNPNQSNDQFSYQTEKHPSKPSDQSNEFVYPQAWPVMVRSNNDHQVLPQNEPPLLTTESVEEFLMNDSQEMMEGKNHQLLHQTEQSLAETIYSRDQLLSDISKIQNEENNIQGQYSQVMMDGRTSQVRHRKEKLSVLSNSVAEAIYSQDQALRDICKNQIFGFGTTENIHGQYSPVMMQGRNSQVLHQNEQLSVPSNSIGETIYGQDQALSDICKIQSFGLGKSEEIIQDQSVSVKRSINTPDLSVRKRSSVKFKVLVQPFQKTTKVEMYINSDETLEELRKNLAKLQEMGVLDLPEEGYFFIHKQNVLTDHQTFEENLVAPFDTIQIFRNEGSVPPRTPMSR